MLERELTVSNRLGLHARATAASVAGWVAAIQPPSTTV